MDVVLDLTLQVAVPLHIAELRRLNTDARTSLARAAADVVASHGDDLQFGGVTFAGLHFCTDHQTCVRATAAAATTGGTA